MWALPLAVLCAGCAHHALETVAGPSVATVGAGESGRQALLRVRYRGIDGRGRVRLAVRVAFEEGFQLAAADVFGRQLWSFSGGGGDSLLLDHRRREVCRFDGDVVFRAIALSELPVDMLPRVLLGELPFEAPAEGDSDELDLVDSEGRRWTAKLGADSRPASWTLWEDTRAVVWWRVTDEGAILSHRGGAQVSWAIVAEEPLVGPLPALEEPAGYTTGQCDEPDVP